MSEKAKWILILGGGFVLACGFCGLNLFQHRVIERNREEVSRLREEIEAGRKLVKSTPELEREVITQRETDAVIKGILSDEEDVNNFVRTIREFENASKIAITSVKKVNTHLGRGRKKDDFDRVAYTLTFDADAFQLLSFLDEVETYSRFISVTAFKLTAAKRNQLEKGGEPVHNVTLNLETYVYKPTEGKEPVRIDNYERKRDFLLSDIQRRRDELRIPVYDYRGSRGRRDPWVDPRVPVSTDGVPVLTIEEQIAIVDGLLEQAATVETLWTGVEAADNLIAEMKARAAVEKALAELEEEVRRVEAADQLIFAPSVRRFEHDVVGVVQDVRQKLTGSGPSDSPTTVALREAAESMKRHIDNEEYELALATFRTLEPRLPLAEREEHKLPLVAELKNWAHLAKTVLDFEEIGMEIGGVAIMEGRRPVALINGDSIVAGEFLDLSGEIFVQDIRSDEIEFIYRGVTLVRRIGDQYVPKDPPSGRARN